MIIAANPPIELPLEKLNPAQKWKLVQYLWEDLATNHQDEIEAPAWHEEVLRERERKIASGEAKYVPLEEFAEQIRQKIK
jgi:Putative addiction module component